MQKILIYTDGACRHNPGPGGWGVLIKYGSSEKTFTGAEAQTTNNRMELMAAVMGLRSLEQPAEVKLYTDSQYVQKGISVWVIDWQRRGWKTSQGQAVKNQDLWQALLLEASRHQVSWHWVKAHAGDPDNETVDRLARQAIDELLV